MVRCNLFMTRGKLRWNYGKVSLDAGKIYTAVVDVWQKNKKKVS